jgi:Zn-finger nucleic acid-binding protein
VQPQAAPYPQQGYQQPHYGHHKQGYGYKRKKSWLEDIFD